MNMNLTGEERKALIVDDIRNNYRQMEKSIIDQLYLCNRLHYGITGGAREDVWRQLFEMIVPRKFVIEKSVFIIDSKEGISREVDLAIFDETYTPYIFHHGELKFIPIEAVAAVVECKSHCIDEDALSEWSRCIDNLRTSGESIARMAPNISFGTPPMQSATRPLKILCALQDETDENKKKTTVSASAKTIFDFVLTAVKKSGNEESRILIETSPKYESLWDWYWTLNHADREYKTEIEFEEITSSNAKSPKSSESSAATTKKKALTDIGLASYDVKADSGEDIALLSLNFKFNQLLMLINNPILFPHKSYAMMFNEKKS